MINDEVMLLLFGRKKKERFSLLWGNTAGRPRGTLNTTYLQPYAISISRTHMDLGEVND
jgi:hypothetical protein